MGLLQLLVLLGLSLSSLGCLTSGQISELTEDMAIFMDQFQSTLDMMEEAGMGDLDWIFTEEFFRLRNDWQTLLGQECVECAAVNSFLDEAIEHMVFQVSFVEPDWETLVRNGDPIFVNINDLLNILKAMKLSCQTTLDRPHQNDDLLDRSEEYAEDDGEFEYWTPEWKPKHLQSDKIINGSSASPSNWPFIVSIGGCTGSLISNTCVLSAAHCGSSRTVRIGSSSKTSGGSTFNVASIVSHSSLDIHIAILSSRPSSSIPRVRVSGYTASTPSINRTSGLTGGYGATRLSGSGGGTLRQVTVQNYRISNSRIDVCPAGNTECRLGGSTGGPLWGDSGGPLLRGSTQIGTVRGCPTSDERYLGIWADYVNTENLGSWIRSRCG